MFKRFFSIILLITLVFILVGGVFAINNQGRPDAYGGHYSYNDNGQITGYVYVEGFYDGWSVTCNHGVSSFTKSEMDACKPFQVNKELKIKNKMGLWEQVWSSRNWYRITPSPTATATTTSTSTSTETSTPTSTPTSTAIETSIPTEKPTSTAIETKTPISTITSTTTSTPIVTSNETEIPVKTTPAESLPQTGEDNHMIIYGISVILIGIIIGGYYVLRNDKRVKK